MAVGHSCWVWPVTINLGEVLPSPSTSMSVGPLICAGSIPARSAISSAVPAKTRRSGPSISPSSFSAMENCGSGKLDESAMAWVSRSSSAPMSLRARTGAMIAISALPFMSPLSARRSSTPVRPIASDVGKARNVRAPSSSVQSSYVDSMLQSVRCRCTA